MHLRASLPAAAALLAACGLMACSSTAPRTSPQRAADAAVAEQVQAALLADPDIYARHIDIRVDRGVVHLGGYVWEAQDFRTAQRDAAAVPGVTQVVADMELMRGGLSGTSR